MKANRQPPPALLREIARLRAALRKEGSAYVCEPEKPRLWSQHGGKRWQSMDRDEKAAVREGLRNGRNSDETGAERRNPVPSVPNE